MDRLDASTSTRCGRPSGILPMACRNYSGYIAVIRGASVSILKGIRDRFNSHNLGLATLSR